MRQLRVLSGVATICAAFVVNQPAQAGFGLFGGHHGAYGSYGSSGGSSGGASYGGSSGGASYGGSSGGSSGAYAASYASYGSSGGGSAGYGSTGFGSSGDLGSSGGTGHVGPLRRLAARIHSHHAAKVAARGSSSGSVAVYSSSYGSSGGSSGGGYVGGSSGSSVPAVSYYGGSMGSSGGSSGYSSPAPVMSYPTYDSYAPMSEGEMNVDGGYDSGSVVEPPPVPPVPAPGTEARLDSDAALLTIAVPESAKVVVNGRETSSRGEVRQFMSNGLKDGMVYTYVVEVTFADGEATSTKTVKLRAGAAERLVFNEPVDPASTVSATSAPETVVTLRVPADAVVNLAGNDTKGEGDVRTFRTRQLADGHNWDSYTIRVTSVVDGLPVTKEKTIDLVAGSDHDFTFEFDNASLASR